MTSPDAAYNPPASPPPGTPDFTKRRDPIPFRIAPDIFRAPPILSPLVLVRIAGLAGSLSDLQGVSPGQDTAASLATLQRALEAMAEAFRIILGGTSGKLFADRLMSDGTDENLAPIDLIGEAMPALFFLLERYGLRPTPPSSDSPSGSVDGETTDQNAGASSTDGASPEASTT